MAAFFPRHSVSWQLEEPPAFRRLSLLLVVMAAATGVIIRLFRWAALSYSSADSWWLVIGGYAVGAIVLLGLATAHLGNYPVRHWLWRAPLFGLVEGAAELAVSALLVSAGLERVGTELAHWHDWREGLVGTIGRRVLIVSLFALVLAGVVQIVRFVLLKRDRRDSTAIAIHEEHVRQSQEHEVPK